MIARELGLVLVCDLDGVVFDFDREWVARHRAWWPEAPDSPEVAMPQMWDDLHLLSGLGHRQVFWDWWYASGGFVGLPLYPGARDALWFARDRGWSIVYATNRPTPDVVTAEELVRAGLPDAHQLEHTDSKWELPASLFLEDAPHNLEMMHAVRGSTTLRVVRPWNRIEDYPQLADIPSISNLTRDTLAGPVAIVERLWERRKERLKR